MQPMPATTSAPSYLGFKPRLVVTRSGKVAGRFQIDHAAEAYALALRLAQGGDPTVRLYEVDWRLPAPPAEGTQVQPDDLDWVQVE